LPAISIDPSLGIVTQVTIGPHSMRLTKHLPDGLSGPYF